MSDLENALALAGKCKQLLPEVMRMSAEVIHLLATMQRTSPAASSYLADLRARHDHVIAAIRLEADAMAPIYLLYQHVDFAAEVRTFNLSLQTVDWSLLDSEEKVGLNTHRLEVIVQVPQRVTDRITAAQFAIFALVFSHHEVMATFLRHLTGTERYVAEMQRVGGLLATAAAGTLVPILEPVQRLVEIFTSEFDRNMKALLAATSEFGRVFALREGLDNLVELCAQTHFVIDRAQTAVRDDVEEFRTYLAMLRRDLGIG